MKAIVKRIGLFLLAVVMVAGLAGCSGDSSASFTIALSENCAKYKSAKGIIQNVNTGQKTGEIVLTPGKPVTIDLQSAGQHHIHFITPFRYSWNGGWTYWEFNRDINDGDAIVLGCK